MKSKFVESDFLLDREFGPIHIAASGVFVPYSPPIYPSKNDDFGTPPIYPHVKNLEISDYKTGFPVEVSNKEYEEIVETLIQTGEKIEGFEE